MVRNHRGSLAIIVAAALLMAGVAAAIVVWHNRLPDPATADRDGLFRWLITRDLSQESPETQLTLARRLEEECRDGLDCRSAAASLTDEQRTRLWSNVLVLLKPWFLEKVEQYSALAAAERQAYVDEFLASVASWQGVEAFCPPQEKASAESGKSGGLIGILLGSVKQWEAAAASPQKEQMTEFLTAVKGRYLQRSLERLFSSPQA
jgi:hypothetical protein